MSDELDEPSIDQAMRLGTELKLVAADDAQLITDLLAKGFKSSDFSDAFSTHLTSKRLKLEQGI